MEVLRAIFKRWQAFRRNPVRQAGPALVNQNEATERCQPAKGVSQPRLLPGHFKMADPARHQYEVDRPCAEHLVGNMKFAAPGIVNRWNFHGSVLWSNKTGHFAKSFFKLYWRHITNGCMNALSVVVGDIRLYVCYSGFSGFVNITRQPLAF